MDILLVIGAVTAEQYQPIMQKMREHGMEPEIVTITTEFYSHGDFARAATKHMPYPFPPERAELYVQCWSTQRQREIIREAFGSRSVMDVKGVVRFEQTPTVPPVLYMDWLMELLPTTPAVHLVYTGEDGSTWIDGDYGHLETLASA